MTALRTWLAIAAGAPAAAGAVYAARAARTWWRYGRPRTAHPDEADPLLDRFMPQYDVVERHARAIAAPPDVTFAAARAIRLDGSRIVRAIFDARARILRGTRATWSTAGGIVEQMTSIGWGLMAETPTELVFGAITQPWLANPVFRAVPPDELAGCREPDAVKIVWTLRVDPTADGGSVFRTETRAVGTDANARTKFRRYWALLSPGIVAIRALLMPAIEREAMRRWRLEGDDLVPDARAELTHAIAIDARPEQIWPWLVQMGCQRAGWYSWDRLDNAGVRSADRIIPALQQLRVGDVLPARPVGDEGFEVLRIVPQRALVLRGLSRAWAGTWTFVLEPLSEARTRLITRYRAAYPPSLMMAAAVPVLATVHAFMERKQLRTIRHHAEHAREAPPAPTAGPRRRARGAREVGSAA